MRLNPRTRLGLRARMMLFITALLAVILLAAAALVIVNARHAVTQEMESTVSLAAALIGGTLPAETDRDSLIARVELLPDLRHLCLRVLEADAEAPQCPAAAAPDAPQWFARLTEPPHAPERRLQLAADGATLLIQADPADEVAEVWVDTRGLLGLILAFYVIALAVVFRTLGRSTGPIKRISDALVDVERGDFDRRLPAFDLPEFDRIAQSFNHMAASLDRAHVENQRLHRHAMRVQEHERAHLARELHDELGQSLTAIRADAAGILGRRDTLPEDVAESAGAIADVAGSIYDQTRAMMRRLRPPGLDELGLTAALEENIAGWRRLCPGVDHQLQIRGDPEHLDEDLAIHLFRIIQEALTNCHRHAAASQVVIHLDADGDTVHLSVADDGRGFDQTATTPGLGLSGMRQRAELLGGDLRIERRQPQGTRLSVRLPAIRAG